METTYQQFQEALLIVESYKKKVDEEYKQFQEKLDSVSKFIGVTKSTFLVDLIPDLDVRTTNCLRYSAFFDPIETVGDLGGVKLSDLKRTRNLGKKSIELILEICFYAGIELMEG